MRKEILSHSIKWFLLFVFSIVLVFLSFQFQDKLSQFRSLGLWGIFIINFLANSTIFLPAPAIATVVGGGVVYPPFFVAMFASIGGALGDLVGYFVGLSGNKLLINRQKRFNTIIRIFKRFGGIIVFIFAFVPNPFFDAIGIVAGGLGYPLWKFFIWLFAGRLARNLILAFAGARI